jgi:hypothetical protein
MSVEAKLKDLSSDIHEILASHAAVRGDDFAQAVAVAFELRQMLEIMGRLHSMCREEAQEYAESLVHSAMDIMSSVMCKAVSDDLSKTDIQDALSCADMLMRRRGNTVDRIRKDLERGGD